LTDKTCFFYVEIKTLTLPTRLTGIDLTMDKPAGLLTHGSCL